MPDKKSKPIAATKSEKSDKPQKKEKRVWQPHYKCLLKAQGVVLQDTELDSFMILRDGKGLMSVGGVSDRARKRMKNEWCEMLGYPRINSDGKLEQVEKLISIGHNLLHREEIVSDLIVKGAIVSLEPGRVAIEIRPNEEKNEGVAPFQVTLLGELEGAKVGDFWRVDCAIDENDTAQIQQGKLLYRVRPKFKKKRVEKDQGDKNQAGKSDKPKPKPKLKKVGEVEKAEETEKVA